MAVARDVDPIGSGVVTPPEVAARALARRPLGSIEPGRERFRLEVERRLQQARIDAAALAGALAAHQGCEHSHSEERRTMVVDDRYANRARASRRLPRYRHQPEQGLRQQMLTGTLRIWPVRAVAGGGGIDQGRLVPSQRVVTQAELVHDTGAEILRDHVGACDELERDLLALRHLEIERNAALVAVGADMQHPLAVRRLDRDHVGAEISERLDALRSQQEMIEADHADALQQVEHRIVVPAATFERHARPRTDPGDGPAHPWKKALMDCTGPRTCPRSNTIECLKSGKPDLRCQARQ